MTGLNLLLSKIKKRKEKIAYISIHVLLFKNYPTNKKKRNKERMQMTLKARILCG
jgi:hypothetical protein